MKKVFAFRIIHVDNITDVFDETLSTPIESLTAEQVRDYLEVEQHLLLMKKEQERKRKTEVRKKQLNKNIVYRLVSLFGIQ